MRFAGTFTALAAGLSVAHAYTAGFNVAANNPDGSCKTTAQWTTAFNNMKSLPNTLSAVRLYASSDCNTLEMAVPAAISTGVKILVGIWAEDAAHYSAEKQALLSAIQSHGHKWILAISVGSEDLYRNDTTASTLAGQVYDVRGMVRQYGVEQPVGHVDTWTEWVNSANDAVITAVDFIGLDAYPYFQYSTIGNANSTFWTAVQNTKNAAQGKPVWVTETGWPVTGSNYGAAVPSYANARAYWHQVFCTAIQEINIFWYVYQDYNESPSFGIINSAGQRVYDYTAC